jgi:drug/metabolite transporter (DMT)-like permease
MIGVVYRLAGQSIAMRSQAGGLSVASGLLEGVGFAFFGLALQQGLVSVSSALLAMAPLLVVVLAWLVIHEPLRRIQTAGIGLAVVAVLALSLD